MHGFFRTVSLKLERALGSGWACGADIMRLSVWLLLQQQVEAAQAWNSDCFGCEIAEYGRRVVRRPPDNAPGCASYCQVNSSKNTQRSFLCFLSSTLA